MPKPSRRGSLPNDATCRAFGNSSRCVPVAAEGEVRSFAMGCACVSVRCADAVLAAPRSSSRAEIRLLNSILAFSAARVVALALKSESARRALGDGEKAHESSLAFVALPRDERKIARVRDSQVLRPPLSPQRTKAPRIVLASGFHEPGRRGRSSALLWLGSPLSSGLFDNKERQRCQRLGRGFDGEKTTLDGSNRLHSPRSAKAGSTTIKVS